jgi:hypothetical protein
MQKTNQPAQETDKNKGDQSAVEQQKKETMKNPSPESMGGAQNAQQADKQVTNKNQQTGNNDSAPVNPTNTGSESMTAQDHDRMEERSKGMTGQGAGSQSNPSMGGAPDQQQRAPDQQQRTPGQQQRTPGQQQKAPDQQQKGGMDSPSQGQSKNQGK